MSKIAELAVEEMRVVAKTPARTQPVYKFSQEGVTVKYYKPGDIIAVLANIYVSRDGEHVRIGSVWRLSYPELLWVLERTDFVDGKQYLEAVSVPVVEAPAGVLLPN